MREKRESVDVSRIRREPEPPDGLRGVLLRPESIGKALPGGELRLGVPRLGGLEDAAERGRLIPRAAPRLKETAPELELGADGAARRGEAEPPDRLSRVNRRAGAHDLADAALRLRMPSVSSEAEPLGGGGEVLQIAVAHARLVLRRYIPRGSSLDGASQAECRRCLARFAMSLPPALLAQRVAVVRALAAAAHERHRENGAASVTEAGSRLGHSGRALRGSPPGSRAARKLARF